MFVSKTTPLEISLLLSAFFVLTFHALEMLPW